MQRPTVSAPGPRTASATVRAQGESRHRRTRFSPFWTIPPNRASASNRTANPIHCQRGELGNFRFFRNAGRDCSRRVGWNFL